MIQMWHISTTLMTQHWLADTYQTLTEILIKKVVGFVYFLNKYILC